MHQKT